MTHFQCFLAFISCTIIKWELLLWWQKIKNIYTLIIINLMIQLPHFFLILGKSHTDHEYYTLYKDIFMRWNKKINYSQRS